MVTRKAEAPPKAAADPEEAPLAKTHLSVKFRTVASTVSFGSLPSGLAAPDEAPSSPGTSAPAALSDWLERGDDVTPSPLEGDWSERGDVTRSLADFSPSLSQSSSPVGEKGGVS